MPIISSFFGIYVRMYFADHAPPHIHVEYQGHEALIAIADGSLIEGELPRRAMTLVRQWCQPRPSRRAGAELGESAGLAAAEQNSGSRQ